MNATRASVAALAVLLMAFPAFAADVPAGAASCSGCHASTTRVETAVPPLNGRAAADITGAMIEFKSGKRAGTIMDRIAKGFTDEETRAIAQWYAQQK
jgi:cytochrome subunit of sulfide dehydrogenase